MENFKTIGGIYADYEIGDEGTLYSLKNGRRTLKTPSLNNRGYYRYFLCANGRQKSFFAHRLVYEAHAGPIPEGRQIDHVNGVKTDNRVSNLELVTNRENQIRYCRKRIGSGAKSDEIGIYWEEKRKKWNVMTTVVKGVRLHFGRYRTKKDAKKRYAEVVAEVLSGTLSPELQARVDACIARKINKAS